MKRENGFSMIELMFVIALIGVVAAMVIPSFSQVIKRNRLTSQANDLIASINLARSEAIKRNLNVIICRSNNGTSCANNGGWEQGWLVFTDNNGNTNPDAGEELVVQQALPGGSTLIPNANYTNRITYQARGYVSQQGAFVLCSSDADFTMGRAIIVSPTGRPRTTAANDASSPFNDCNGN